MWSCRSHVLKRVTQTAGDDSCLLSLVVLTPTANVDSRLARVHFLSFLSFSCGLVAGRRLATVHQQSWHHTLTPALSNSCIYIHKTQAHPYLFIYPDLFFFFLKPRPVAEASPASARFPPPPPPPPPPPAPAGRPRTLELTVGLSPATSALTAAAPGPKSRRREVGPAAEAEEAGRRGSRTRNAFSFASRPKETCARKGSQSVGAARGRKPDLGPISISAAPRARGAPSRPPEGPQQAPGPRPAAGLATRTPP